MCDLVEALEEFQTQTLINLSYAYGDVPWTTVRTKLLERNDFDCVYLCKIANLNVQNLCIDRGIFPLPICVVEKMPSKGICYENLWSSILPLLTKNVKYTSGDIINNFPEDPQSSLEQQQSWLQENKRLLFVEKESHRYIHKLFPTLNLIVLKDFGLIKPKKSKVVEV